MGARAYSIDHWSAKKSHYVFSCFEKLIIRFSSLPHHFDIRRSPLFKTKKRFLKHLFQFGPVRCRNAANGCPVEIVDSRSRHEKFCRYQMIACKAESCGQIILLNDLVDHWLLQHNDDDERDSKGDLEANMVRCYYAQHGCTKFLPLEDQMNHQESCRFRPRNQPEVDDNRTDVDADADVGVDEVSEELRDYLFSGTDSLRFSDSESVASVETSQICVRIESVGVGVGNGSNATRSYKVIWYPEVSGNGQNSRKPDTTNYRSLYPKLEPYNSPLKTRSKAQPLEVGPVSLDPSSAQPQPSLLSYVVTCQLINAVDQELETSGVKNVSLDQAAKKSSKVAKRLESGLSLIVGAFL